jgi:hypothetical protein
MSSLLDENLLPLDEARRALPIAPVAKATIWRWSLHGVGGVMLETITIGTRRYTSREALTRFVEATTSARTPRDHDGREPTVDDSRDAQGEPARPPPIRRRLMNEGLIAPQEPREGT